MQCIEISCLWYSSQKLMYKTPGKDIKNNKRDEYINKSLIVKEMKHYKDIRIYVHQPIPVTSLNSAQNKTIIKKINLRLTVVTFTTGLQF